MKNNTMLTITPSADILSKLPFLVGVSSGVREIKATMMPIKISCISLSISVYIQNYFLRARPLNVMYFFKAARYHFMFKFLEFWLKNEKCGILIVGRVGMSSAMAEIGAIA